MHVFLLRGERGLSAPLSSTTAEREAEQHGMVVPVNENHWVTISSAPHTTAAAAAQLQTKTKSTLRPGSTRTYTHTHTETLAGCLHVLEAAALERRVLV